MSMTLVQSSAIPNRYCGMNSSQQEAAREAIDNLQYADVFRGAKSKVSQDAAKTMRVDVQGDVTETGSPIKKNIQVQVNGVSGHSTVAAVLVSTSATTADPTNRLGVERLVKKALRWSLTSKSVIEVQGAIEAPTTEAERAQKNAARKRAFNLKHGPQQ